jgi:hypothetical protein
LMEVRGLCGAGAVLVNLTILIHGQ